MKLPVLLPHCNVPKQQFCNSCRHKEKGRAFRKGVLERNGINCDVDFECPKNKPWIPEDPPEPTKTQQAINATKAVTKGAASMIKTSVLRMDRVPDKQYAERLTTCRKCPGNHAVFRNGALFTCGQFKDSITGKLPTCGCVLTKKARDIKQDCPMGYWKKLTIDGKEIDTK